MSAVMTPPPPLKQPPRLMTTDEFDDLPENGGYELIDGKLVEKPMSA